MKTLLVLGAGFLQRYVIRKAKELGYRVLAIDGNPNAVGFADADESASVNIVDQDACLAYAKQHHVDGVLTAATDYGVLSAAYIAQKLGLPGIPYEAAVRIKNKYAVRRCLFDAKADDTGLSHEVTAATDLSVLARTITYPVMVKPCDGSGSRGTSRVDSAAAFASACQTAMSQSLTGKATVEPFVNGREYGVESFVENGDIHVLGIMQKWMTAPPHYAELGHALPSGLPAETEQKITRCVTRAIQALELTHGAVNMDIILSDTGSVHIVDIGARMGGNLIGSHIIPLGTGVDYMANMIRAAMGDPCDHTPSFPHSAVATRLLALTPGTVRKAPDMAAFETESVSIEHHLAEGDIIREYHTNLDGFGYVICTAADVTQAAESAETIRREIDTAIVRA